MIMQHWTIVACILIAGCGSTRPEQELSSAKNIPTTAALTSAPAEPTFDPKAESQQAKEAGRSALASQDFDAAAKHFRESLVFVKDDDDAKYSLTASWLRLGDITGAMELTERWRLEKPSSKL